MLSSLSVLYDTLGYVSRGFLLEVRAPEAQEHVQTLLVALELDGGRDPHRAAGDSTTVIQETYHGPLPIDLIVLDDVSEMAQLVKREFLAFYTRDAPQKVALAKESIQ